MKKVVLLFLTLLTSQILHSQVTIQMEKDGGVYKVPCTVNGVKMKFIFDTGASSVCMSQTMAQFLLDGEYLSISDIKGTGQSVVADGTIVNHANIVLRDIEIGGLHIRNVKATVLESQNAPLLLGQTAISELGRITIDGNKLIIHTGDNELSDEQIEQLGEQAEKYIKTKSYAAAIECIEKIDEAVGLSEFGLWELCFCYSQNNQYSQCIQACNRWIADFENDDEYEDKYLIYGYLAGAYRWGMKDYNKAILWYQKQTPFLENEEKIMENKEDIAMCYYYAGNPYRAKDLYIEYVNYKERKAGIVNQQTFDKIMEGNTHNEQLGSIYFGYALILYDTNDSFHGDGYAIAAAQLGDPLARKYCKEHGFLRKYGTVKWNFW